MKSGQWVIITGASSGIGKALAYEFAAGGFNLLLTARNEAALRSVGQDCTGKFGAEVEVVPADLSQPDSVDGLIAAIAATDRRYEVLVNNAGFSVHGGFASGDIEQNIGLVNVQLIAAMRLMKAVLPAMIARRSGRILNVASVYSFSPVPFQSIYAASKAFLLSFSSSVQNEIKDSGVTITVFCPGVTQTEFRTRAGVDEKRKNAGMTAQAAAKVAYIETLRGKHLVVPGFLNQLYVFIARLLPNGAVPRIVRFINRQRGFAHH